MAKDIFSAMDDAQAAVTAPAQPTLQSNVVDIFGAMDKATQQKAAQNASLDGNPDQVAESLKISRQTGIPQPAAEANLDQARATAQDQSNQAVLANSPKLADFVASDPIAARIAKDDFDKLGLLEQITAALTSGVTEGLSTNQLGRLGTAKQLAGAVGAETPGTDAQIAGVQARLASQPKLTGALGIAQGFTGFLTGLVDNAVQGGGKGAAIGAAIGAVVTPELLGAGALPGAGVGAVAGFNMDMAQVAAGNAYLKMGQIRGADGQQLSEAGKQFGAVFTGAATYAIGTYAAAIESKLVGETAESLASKAISEAVTTPTFTRAIAEIGKGTVKGAAQGAAVMTAMEASGIIGEEIAKAVSSGDFKTDPAEIVDRLRDAAINGALLIGGMHAAHAGLGLYGDFRNAQRAQGQADMLKNLMEGSTDSKLRERDLQGFQDFMQRQTDGTPVENLYVPAEKVRELYQGMRLDPNALEPGKDPLFGFVPDMAKQLSDAASVGGDVVIKTADFVTHLAGTPLAEKLLPDLRVGADAMSVNEAKAFQKEYADRITQATTEAGKAQPDTPGEKIAADVRQQAVAAGMSDAAASKYAAIYSARYTARAERRGLGEDPHELFKAEAPTIQKGGAANAGRALNQDEHVGGTPYGVNLDTVKASWDAKGIDHSMSEKDGTISLDKIVLPKDERGQGKGTEAMRELTRYADESGQRIVLSPSKDFGATSVGRLKAFYKSLGFVENKGKAKDFTTTASMLREPKEFFQSPKDDESRPIEDKARSDLVSAFADILRRHAPQKTEDSARGSIRFEDGGPIISLFERADASTLLHESGHAWLEELVADGSRPDAPEQLKTDLATIREHLGNDGGEFTTEQHEAFARSAEAYFMEGKAPSQALATVFARFKQWLTKLYRTVASLDTPINPEIRAVFDRLLATDAELAEATKSVGLEPAFKSREDAGMTAAEWKAYTGSIDRANQQAESTLLEKAMAKVRKQRSAEYREERAKHIEAATKEVDSRPDIQALNLLKSTKADAGKEKLSASDIEATYGKEGLANLPKGTYAKEGVHPDYIAEMTGFASGDEMVKALQALEQKQREIRTEEGEKRGIRQYLIDQAVDAKIDPEIKSETSIQEEALAAVHSQKRAELLAQELRYLRRSAARALEERGKGRKAVEQAKTEADWDAAEADLMAKLDRAKDQNKIDDLKEQIQNLKDERKQAKLDESTARDRMRAAVNVTRPMLEAMRKQVDGILEAKTVEDVASFGKYLRDERKAAREVQEAIRKKDWQAAADAKQRQIISHVLYTQAKEASKAIDSGKKNMERLADSKAHKGIDQAYTDQLHALLERFGFQHGRGEELDRAGSASLEEFVKAKAEDGVELSVDPAIYTLAKDFDSLTYGEFKALDEAVRSMQTIGREEKTVTIMGERFDKQLVIDDMVKAIRALGERMKSDFYDPADAGKLAAAKEKLFSTLRGIDAALTKPEALFDQIDKANPDGIMNRAIFRPLKEAQGREDRWQKVASDEMKAAVDAAGKDWRKRMDDTVPDDAALVNPETSRPMKLTRKRMLSMALNWGNEGNRTKLADGYKWDQKAIKAFLDRNMTKADWDFVQKVWQMFDSHKQDLDDLQRRVTGVGLDMVHAGAFDTPHGGYEGGYYPIVYDAGKSFTAETHAEKATDALFPNGYTRATTPKGSTISRVEGVKRPIQLSLDVAPWKIGQVLHDLAFREAIIDADRLLSDDAVKKAFDDVFGPEYRKTLRPWLKHVANARNIDDASIGWIDKAIQTARTNTVIVGIGFRLSTILKHDLTALANSIGEVGGTAMLKETAAFYKPGRMAENWKFITDRSAEMQFRINAYDKDVASRYNALIKDSAYTAFQKQAQHFGHIAVSYLDLGTAAPTWMAAYRKAIDAGREEKDAIYIADKTVRNAHGAQGITDTALIQRAKGAANLINMFYGFFNHVYNRQRTIVMKGAEGIGNVKAGQYKAATRNFAEVLARSFWYLAVPALIEAMVAHGGPNEDKDEGWAGWAAKSILGQIPAGIPILRDIAKAAIEGRDYEGSPVVNAVNSVIRGGRDVYKWAEGDDLSPNAGKHLATAAGLVTGLPTAAPWTAGKFLWDVNNGDADPQSVKEWIQGLMTGRITAEHK